jgi:uncharacterized membrane protein
LNATLAARRTRIAVFALLATLFVASACAVLRESASDGATTLLAVFLLVPLALPLPGLVRSTRRTHAWATLCLTPHFLYALTEMVANPALRPLAGLIFLLALSLLVALVAYLRLTRPGPA